MQPYVSAPLPLDTIDFGRLVGLVGKANGELARFDGLLHGIVNADLLLSPLTTNEAVLSSRIEGTQATLGDVLEFEAGIEKPEALRDDIDEIINYRKALLYSQEYLLTRPISLGFLRELHQILMNSVRGAEKTPGKFRETQNYIGQEGASLANATFVPPSPVRLMSDLEDFQRYMESDDKETLIQTAIVHAQFELIHPFNDGNGRIGRLLIPLFLYQKKKLSRPIFYISGYLEAHREEYYARLRAISREQDWNGWIEYFLRAVAIEAKNCSDKVKQVLELYQKMKIKIPEVTRSKHSSQILDAIFHQPTFRSTDFVRLTGIPSKTSSLHLRWLKQSAIIEEFTPSRGASPTVWVFPQLLNITEGRQVIPIPPGLMGGKENIYG
jgi:Fic family protein